MENISLCYLSWKRHNILQQTLRSHLNNGLHDIILPDNRLIFFQEKCDEDEQISKSFNLKYLGNNNNIGILNAFIILVENCTTKYLLFSENDWYLNERACVTKNTLEDCESLLSNDCCDIIRLRHLEKPGEPLFSRPNNVDSWLLENISKFPYKLESFSWIKEPNIAYNNLFLEYEYNYKWYVTNLDHQRWSNNIFIAKTSYLKECVLPLIEYFKENNDNYLGLEEILINYNNYYGKSEALDAVINKFKSTKICAGKGLFTHQDKVI